MNAQTLVNLVTTLALQACFGVSPARSEEASAVAGPQVRPRAGEDFNAYANWDWLQRTQIPAGKSRWGVVDELRLAQSARLASVLRDAQLSPANSDGRKAWDLRASLLDSAAIEALGMTPLSGPFAELDRVHDKRALAALLGHWLAADVDPLNAGVYDSSLPIGLSVADDLQGRGTGIPYLLQGGLGLHGPDAYLGSEPARQALRARYRLYMQQAMEAAGFDPGPGRLDAILALETSIARTHGSGDALEDNHNIDHRWARREFPARAPGLDWPTFFRAAGLDKQPTFIAWQPRSITGVAELVGSTPLATWRDYLRWRLIDHYGGTLPHAIAERSAAFHRSEVDGPAWASTREQQALDRVLDTMPGALDRLYMDRYLPADQKARLVDIVKRVKAAFGRRIEAVTWMSADTRRIALEKLDTLYFGIGYPESWKSYASVRIDSTDPIGNLRRLAGQKKALEIGRLGRRADPTDWALSPVVVGASSFPFANAYNFAAGLLQPPKFSPGETDAFNYGAIGAIVGHELSHFFDDSGAAFDPQGRPRRWWTAADASQYASATRALADQYGTYHPLPGLAIDGRRTLAESVADLGGLVTAFDAYRSLPGGRPGRDSDRAFFLGFAASWRAKIDEASMRNFVATNIHAPEPYRILTVRNVDAWYDAFDIQPGDPLYLPPSQRVRIW